jgi:hypothetical protein
MYAHVVSITSPNPACILMRIEISAPDQFLFGSLLDSMEGVANHTASDRSNEMRVCIQSSMEPGFQQFLEAWSGFIPPALSKAGKTVPIKTYNSHGRSHTPDV